MSIGFGLLYNLILRRESPAMLDERGIDRSFFNGEEIKVYDFVRNHLIKYGEIPNLKTIQAETKVAVPVCPNEPLDYWIKGIEDRKHSTVILKVAKQAQDAVLKGNIEQARELVRGMYAQTGSRNISEQIQHLQALAPKVLEEHDRLQLSSKMSGVPFGIPYLDEVSGGAQPADSIAIVGTKGVGKSYLLAMAALSCFATDGMPFVATFEMSALQFARRMMALRSHVTAMAIRLGRLSHWARKKLEQDKNWLQERNRPFPIFQGNLKTTVDDLVLRIQELRPTAAYIDGAYLLRLRERVNSRVERITEVAEWLKMVAKDFNIPVFGTYQFSRRGRGLENIGWSDAIGQLASIVLALRDPEEDEIATSGEALHRFDTVQEYKIIDFLKGREGEKGKIRITYDMTRMAIEQDEVLEGYTLPDEQRERTNED